MNVEIWSAPPRCSRKAMLLVGVAGPKAECIFRKKIEHSILLGDGAQVK
jgi:hypothetical protein